MAALGPHRAAVIALVVVVVIVGVLSPPLIDPAAHGRSGGLPAAHSGPTPLGRPALSAPTSPIGGRLFVPLTTPPDGDTNSVIGVAIDPSTGTVFAANRFAGTVTAFNESTGAFLAVRSVAEFAAGSFPSGLALDEAHHHLFVPVSTIYAPTSSGGWMLVLDESTLATVANVSFPNAPLGIFEPTFLAYDPPSGQVFVENASLGEIAAVNLTNDSVVAYLPCPVSQCAMHGYGLLDVPQYHTLLLPTCQPQLWLVNTSNDSTRAVVTGPPNTIMAWSTFDTVDNTLWVENYTYYGPTGSFLRYNLSTLTLLGNYPGAPPRGSAIGYDPIDNLLIATDLNGSEQISVYDAATAILSASFASTSSGVHPFTALALDSRTHVVIASGSGNGTTLAFQLPSLTLRETYPSFPLSQVASSASPVRGTALVLGNQPESLRAVNETTGARAWEATLSGATSLSALAVDPVSGTAYVTDSGAGTLYSISTTDGSVQRAIPLGATVGPCALVLDAGLGALFVGEAFPPAVAQVNLSSGTVVNTLSLPSTLPCSLSVDPVTGDLLALSTNPSGGLTSIALPMLTQSASWPTPPTPVDLAVDAQGVAYVLENAGSQLAVLNGTTGSPLRSVDLGGFRSSGETLDPVDGLLFLSAIAAPSVEVVPTVDGVLWGNLTTSGATAAPSFDASAEALIAPLASNGELYLATMVPVPSAPTSLVAEPGNTSLSASWGAPSTSGPYPVGSYHFTVHASGNATPVLVGDPTAPTGTAENLTDGTAYVVTVTARSYAGLGTSAASAEVTPVGVPYPPTNLRLVSEGPNRLIANWSPPASDDGAPVTDYLVNVTAMGGLTTSVSAGAGLTTTIDGLSANTNYSVVVSAVNSAGTGHPSQVASASTGPAPPPPAVSLGWIEYLVLVAVVVVAAVVLLRRRRHPAPDPRPAPIEGTDDALEPDSEGPDR